MRMEFLMMRKFWKQISAGTLKTTFLYPLKGALLPSASCVLHQ